ncbi:MAG: hypothetical protein WEE89_17785 [Gemmatimonadota bacterium]
MGKREHELVQLRTPDAKLDLAWRWAIQHIDSASMTTNSASHRIGRALDALAIGDFATARGILDWLRDQSDESEFAAPYLWLVTRYFAATGDIGWARHVWRQVRDVLIRARTSAALLRELANTAESIGESAHHQELLAAASREQNQGDPNRHLQGQFGPAALLGRIASGRDPAWPPGSVAAFVSGLLGIEPDAARNRVGLRPSVPADWDRLEADNLRVGDGTLGLRYERVEAEHRFRVLPQTGGVPFRVVFEPAVTGDRVSTVIIDGQAAQLDVRRVNERWLCPVQVDLDRERVVTIFMASTGNQNTTK